MEIYKAFKVFGLYFYVSSIRMKKRRTADERMRNMHNILRKKKKMLYKTQNGCCACCGKRFIPEALEIHHIVGINENPGLATNIKNLQLLCHECHVRLHKEKRRAANVAND